MTSAGFAELILKPVADLRSTFLEKKQGVFENIIISSVVRCYTTEYDGSIADNLLEVPTRSFAIFEGVRAIGKILEKM